MEVEKNLEITVKNLPERERHGLSDHAVNWGEPMDGEGTFERNNNMDQNKAEGIILQFRLAVV